MGFKLYNGKDFQTTLKFERELDKKYPLYPDMVKNFWRGQPLKSGYEEELVKNILYTLIL